MTRWLGIVLAPPAAESDAMVSRLPTVLHPIAGRPLVWHVAASVAAISPPPDRIVVVAEGDVPAELFADLPVEVDVVAAPAEPERSRFESDLPWGEATHGLVVHAAASIPAEGLAPLTEREAGRWIADRDGGAVAAWLPAHLIGQLFRLNRPLSPPHGVFSEPDRLPTPEGVFLVRDREGLAVAGRRVRDRLVRQLMAGGATFLLPDSVLVDVDVRLGRDTVVYPGAVLEGQTTVGDETVIGPGCRIISSWVGSGVELKGWNYVAHTSLRNRAILEPYVRRGFD